jgi:hypothetical protein
MPTFEEIMEQYRNPGENGVPDNFADEIQSAYREEIGLREAAIADRDQKLADAEKARAERDAEVTRLKAVNYDLLVAAPKAGNPAEENKPDGGAAQGGIDSLFE